VFSVGLYEILKGAVVVVPVIVVISVGVSGVSVGFVSSI
jgi:hypothetical protein